MTVVLRTLSENLSEKLDAVPPPALPSTTAASSDSVSNKDSQGSAGPGSSKNLLVLVVFMLFFFFSPKKLMIKFDINVVAHLQGFMEIVSNVWICALFAL